jgi:hypothetical protein
LKPSTRVALFDLNRLVSDRLCADANFSDQSIELWITQKLNGAGLLSMVLKAIPVSIPNLMNISTIVRCTPSNHFREMFRLDRFVPSSELEMVAVVYVIMCSDSIDSAKILESLPEDIDENALINLTLVLSEKIVTKRLSLRSDLLSYILKRFKGDQALRLKFIANNCRFGRISVGFWDHWSSVLTESLDFGLRHFECTSNLEVFNWVVLVAFHYIAQDSEPLSPYYSSLYDIWTNFRSIHQPCGIVNEISELLSMVSRHHITNSFKTIDPAIMLKTFRGSADIHDLLVVRFFMVLKIDEVLETRRVEVAKQPSVTELFPFSNIRTLYCEEISTMKKLLLVDIFMSYLEGAADVSGLASLYNEAFREISRDVIELCLEVLGWNTMTPFDLSKHEFIIVDSEGMILIDSRFNYNWTL